MSTRTDYGNVMVCTDCYFAHHYGASEHDREPTADEWSDWHGGYLRGHALPNITVDDAGEYVVREWFAGESDSPCDREPLCKLDGYELSDNTCSNHNGSDVEACSECEHEGYEDGIVEFSRRSCDGCGSTLGGSRYRLAVWA